jgi:hypothetical protein
MSRQAITIHTWKFLHPPPYLTSFSPPSIHLLLHLTFFLLITIHPSHPLPAHHHPSISSCITLTYGFRLCILSTCIMESDHEPRMNVDEDSPRPLPQSSSPRTSLSEPADQQTLMAELDSCVELLDSIDLKAQVSPRDAEAQLVASRMAIACSKVTFTKLCKDMNERASQLSAVQKEVLEDKKRLEKAWEDFHQKNNTQGLEHGQEQTGLRQLSSEEFKRILEQQTRIPNAELKASIEKLSTGMEKILTRMDAGTTEEENDVRLRSRNPIPHRGGGATAFASRPTAQFRPSTDDLRGRFGESAIPKPSPSLRTSLRGQPGGSVEKRGISQVGRANERPGSERDSPEAPTSPSHDSRQSDSRQSDSRQSDSRHSESPLPVPRKKRKSGGLTKWTTVLSSEELFRLLVVWNPETRQVTEAVNLSDNLKAIMLRAGLSKFREPKNTEKLMAHPRTTDCAHNAVHNKKSLTMGLSSCEPCLRKTQVCVKKERDMDPMILPLPADRRQGRTFEDAGFWCI